MKINPVGAQLFHTVGQKNKWDQINSRFRN